MKNNILFLLVIISSFGFAQKLDWGTVNKGERAYTFNVLKDDSGNIYSIKFNQKKRYYVVDKHNAKLELKATIQLLPKKVLPKKAEVIDIEFVRNELVVIFQIKDKKAKTTKVYKQAIESKNLTTVFNDHKLLCEISLGKRGESNFTFLKQNKHFVIVGTSLVDEKLKQNRITICFNEGLKEKWRIKGKTAFPFKETEEITSSFISKSGDYYNVIKKLIPKKERHAEGAIFKSYIEKTNSSGTILKHLSVKKFASSAEFIQHQNKLKIIGTYSFDQADESRGVFCAISGFNLERITVSSSDFGIDFIKSNILNRESRRLERKETKAIKKSNISKLPTIDYLKINSLIKNEDGSVIVITEVSYDKLFIETVYDANGNQRKVNKHYFIRGVVCVFKLNSNGGLIWKVKVPKYQVEENFRLNTGIIAAKKENQLLIFYNDHKDNFLKQDGHLKLMSNTFRDGCLAVSTINLVTGALDIKMLTRYNTSKQFIMPVRDAMQIGGIVMPGGSGKKQSLVRINL